METFDAVRLVRAIYEYPDGSDANGDGMAREDPAIIDRRLRRACKARARGWSDLYKRYVDMGKRIDEIDVATRLAYQMEGVEGVKIPEMTDEFMDDYKETEGTVMEVIREAFQILPFDRNTGLGLTESQTFQVLQEFFRWNKKKGESINASLISSVLSDGDHPDSLSGSLADRSTTNSSTDSNLTPGEPMAATAP